MRTAAVRWTALVFTLALALAATGSAWLAARAAASEPAVHGGSRRARPADPASGASELDRGSLYALYCGECHVVEELTPYLRGPDPGAAVLELLEFLDGHGRSDAVQDRAIVAHLLAAR